MSSKGQAVTVALAAVILPLASGACGLALTHGPPRGHERMSTFSCTQRRTGPIVDLVLAGLGSLVALAAVAGEPDTNPNSNQFAFVAGGLASTGILTVSGVLGLRKVARCERAKRLRVPAPATRRE